MCAAFFVLFYYEDVPENRVTSLVEDFFLLLKNRSVAAALCVLIDSNLAKCSH